MWFNEKNAIKKLARNLYNDMKKMNVITIETVKNYGSHYLPQRVKNQVFWCYVVNYIFGLYWRNAQIKR